MRENKKKGRGGLNLPSDADRDFFDPTASMPSKGACLDPVQLFELEKSFRRWAEQGSRVDIRAARKRILIIFLIIRYTGAKLNEVLRLNLPEDLDFENGCVRFGGNAKNREASIRTVQGARALLSELKALMHDPVFSQKPIGDLCADPGFVRRKFYERAEDCGFPKEFGAPESLRRARAVELVRNNMPLPAVQMLLGHATPNRISSYAPFPEDDLQEAVRFFLEKESGRKTSARNSFFGKISDIKKGDIQAQVKLMTMGKEMITTVITTDSLERLGLKKDRWITAEVKAPWVTLARVGPDFETSADNRLDGSVQDILIGEINTECRVVISDGTRICAVITTDSARRLALKPGDAVHVLFSSSAVVLLST